MLLGLIALFYSMIEIMGVVSAIHAVLHVRTSQAAIAWVVSLITFPLLTLPFYWVLGRNKFNGYVEAMRSAVQKSGGKVQKVMADMEAFRAFEGVARKRSHAVFEALGELPFTRGNHVTLLKNGHETFNAICRAIADADSYILLQFFIVRDDRLGRRLLDLLCERARAGVRVCFLYDEIGSRSLPEDYLHRLGRAGGTMRPFATTRGRYNRFQLNFRNHRKTVIVDGRLAFVGGHNIGDEYLGRSRRFGFWRDTHLRLEGPSVKGVQLPFAADWHWATGEVLDALDWIPEKAPSGDQIVLPLPTDPSHHLDSCSLMFVNAILAARERVWIATPYFIPNDAVQQALQIVALRGVDVRVLLPERPDKRVVWLAGHAYLGKLARTGLRVFRYRPGFMHQKVMLIDEKLALVGTANADNRSFQLNFETTILVSDTTFSREVAAMLEADMAQSRMADAAELPGPEFLFRLLVRLASLFSPIL